MHYIIISDIYGLTSHLNEFCTDLNSACTIISPYSKTIQGIENEADYYNEFIKQCTHPGYTNKVLNCFNSLTEQSICIAFSAGASAAWRAQLLTTNAHLKKIIGFYPSKIRDDVALDAKIPCEFIFAQSEHHFNVVQVMSKLSSKSLVHCTKADYLHGFMNPKSENYNAQAYREYLHYLCSLK
ncbi:dienelactone hydrolase family protein [Pseudoalteromonas sp. MMG010]|uniref:dienelactone hydrolase family protein n=1 Tax=Pseudoalteromonas sp. MMG010 TaxID=2822685 RepID=UPI001B3A3BCA|nr:dienelactone hydrolase family protein [Pseudoalteromonas sp. MMG010]MBQ4832260.1 dienelactone hydrolase family protein [Pseudoalteromonas sp. MMG010]